MPAHDAKRSLTVPEFAERYRIGEDRVRAMIGRGEIAPGINTAVARCGRARYVILPEALERFEQGRRAAAPTSPTPRRTRRRCPVDYYPD